VTAVLFSPEVDPDGSQQTKRVEPLSPAGRPVLCQPAGDGKQ
jgi:hypothetical protein